MADRYWVGGAGTWNTINTTNWSATSGGAGGASVPTTADDVFFDAASGTGTIIISVNNGAKSLNCTGYAGSVNHQQSLSLAGSLTLSAGMTYITLTGVFVFTATGTIISAGKTLRNGTVNAPGGVVTLGDALISSNGTSGGAFTVTAGTFSTAGYSVTIDSLSSNNSNVRTIDFGASTVSIGGGTSSGVTSLDLTTTTNLTFNAGTSQITFGASTTSIVIGGGVTFNNVILTSPSTASISGANTFNNFTITKPSFLGTVSFAGNQSINGTLTLPNSANAWNRTTLQSSVFGTTRTLTVAALAAGATDIDFYDIAVTGAAAPLSITRAGDCGGNSGITFPAGKTVYFAGTTSWYTGPAWSATAGGAADSTMFPLPQDTAVFTSTVPASGGTVTIDGQWNLPTIDGSARTANTMSLSYAPFSNVTTRMIGNFIGGSGFTLTSSGADRIIYLSGRGTQTLNQNGATLNIKLGGENFGGTLRLDSNITLSGANTLAFNAFTFNYGTLLFNGYTLDVFGFSNTIAGVRNLNFSSGGYLICSGNATTVYNQSNSSNFTITGTFYVLLSYTGATGTRTISSSSPFSLTLNRDIAVGGTSGFVLNSSSTDTVSFIGGYENINLTNMNGSFSCGGLTAYGNVNIGTTATIVSNANVMQLSPNGVTRTITSNGRTINFPVTIATGTGTVQLADALTVSSARTTFLSQGTLDLNGFTLTTGVFNSSGSNARTIAFGAGNITTTGTGTVWDTTTGTNFSCTGSRTVNIANNSATATTVITGSIPINALLDFNYTTGTYTLTDANSTYRSLNFTGFAGTVRSNSSRTIYGNFNAGSTAALGDGGTTQTTFASTSGVSTITSNGRTISINLLFNGVGGTWQLQDALTVFNTFTTTLTAGTIDLNGFTFSTGLFNSSGTSARTIAFGAGNIALTGTGIIWTTADPTNFSRTGTPTVNVTNSSATARTVSTGSMTEAQALDFNYTAGSYTLTDTSARYRNLNLTGFSGTFANTNRTYFGGFNAGSTATMTAGTTVQTFAATSGTWDITSNGRTLDFPITFNGIGGTWRLQGTTVVGSTRTTNLSAGTLDLNGFTFRTGLFDSNTSTTRQLAFNAGTVEISGNANTVWSISNTTGFSTSGTFKVVFTYTGATGTRTVVDYRIQNSSAPAVSTSGSSGFIFDTTSTDVKGLTGYFGLVDLTNMLGFLSPGSMYVFDNFNAGSTITIQFAGTPMYFSTVTGTKTITTNGRSFGCNVNFEAGASGSWQLQDAMTISSGVTATLTSGQLDLNNYTLTTSAFSSNNSNVRSIAFGTGQISLTGNGTTIWATNTATNFSFTGTFRVVATYTGAAGTRTLFQGFASEATVQPISTTGSSGFILDTSSTDTKALSGSWGNFDMTGVTGTLSNTARTIYGNFNAGSAVTLTAGTNATTFAGTSGVDTITTNGRTLDFPLTFNGVGGTWQLQDALTSGSTRTSTLTAGTLDLNGFTYTTGLFSVTGTSVRAIAFGTGNITLNGTGTVWNATTLTNFTRTGTPTINVSNNSATATTVTTGTPGESQALDFNYTTGTYALTDTSAVYRSLSLTGFAGTFPNNARTYYGGFNAGSTATMTAGTNTQTFAATSGTWGITSNGRTLDFPLTFNGVNGTWQLQGALTMGTTRAFTLTSGTFDANNYNVTAGTVASSNSNVRTLALGSGTWTVAGNAWTFTTSTNATITGTATISMTSASAKSFQGGGLTWPTLNQGGAGALTIFGNNTFTNITSTYTATGACNIAFPNTGTQTLANFTASGTAGKLLSLTSNGGGQTNLVINNDVNLSYTSIINNSVSGGYVYNALQTNGNVNAGNNFGWVFSLGGGSFISFF